MAFENGVPTEEDATSAAGSGAPSPVTGPSLPSVAAVPWAGTAQDPRLAMLAPPPQAPLGGMLGKLALALVAASQRGQGAGNLVQGYEQVKNNQALQEDRNAQAIQRRAMLTHQIMLEQHQAQMAQIQEQRLAANQAASDKRVAEKKAEDARRANSQAANRAWNLFQQGGGVDRYNEIVASNGPQAAQAWIAAFKTPKGPFDELIDGGPPPSMKDLFEANAQIDPFSGKAIGGKPTEKVRPELVAFMKDRNKTVDTATTKDWAAFNEWEAEHKKPKDPEDLPLSQPAIEMYAKQLAQTGQMSYSGFGKTAVTDRRKIANRAAEIFPGLDLASQKAGYTANAASLSKLTQMYNNVQAFSNTAEKNADILLGIGQKLIDSKSSWVNKPLRTVSERLLNDADVTAFRAAASTVAPEYARILNSANLSGALTNNARDEISQYLGPDATLEQVVKAIGILKQENQNRLSSLREQIGGVKRLLATAPGEVKPQAGTDFDFTFDPATGALRR